MSDAWFWLVMFGFVLPCLLAYVEKVRDRRSGRRPSGEL